MKINLLKKVTSLISATLMLWTPFMIPIASAETLTIPTATQFQESAEKIASILIDWNNNLPLPARTEYMVTKAFPTILNNPLFPLEPDFNEEVAAVLKLHAFIVIGNDLVQKEVLAKQQKLDALLQSSDLLKDALKVPASDTAPSTNTPDLIESALKLSPEQRSVLFSMAWDQIIVDTSDRSINVIEKLTNIIPALTAEQFAAFEEALGLDLANLEASVSTVIQASGAIGLQSNNSSHDSLMKALMSAADLLSALIERPAFAIDFTIKDFKSLFNPNNTITFDREVFKAEVKNGLEVVVLVFGTYLTAGLGGAAVGTAVVARGRIANVLTRFQGVRIARSPATPSLPQSVQNLPPKIIEQLQRGGPIKERLPIPQNPNFRPTPPAPTPPPSTPPPPQEIVRRNPVQFSPALPEPPAPPPPPPPPPSTPPAPESLLDLAAKGAGQNPLNVPKFVPQINRLTSPPPAGRTPPTPARPPAIPTPPPDISVPFVKRDQSIVDLVAQKYGFGAVVGVPGILGLASKDDPEPTGGGGGAPDPKPIVQELPPELGKPEPPPVAVVPKPPARPGDDDVRELEGTPPPPTPPPPSQPRRVITATPNDRIDQGTGRDLPRPLPNTTVETGDEPEGIPDPIGIPTFETPGGNNAGGGAGAGAAGGGEAGTVFVVLPDGGGFAFGVGADGQPTGGVPPPIPEGSRVSFVPRGDTSTTTSSDGDGKDKQGGSAPTEEPKAAEAPPPKEGGEAPSGEGKGGEPGTQGEGIRTAQELRDRATADTAVNIVQGRRITSPTISGPSASIPTGEGLQPLPQKPGTAPIDPGTEVSGSGTTGTVSPSNSRDNLIFDPNRASSGGAVPLDAREGLDERRGTGEPEDVSGTTTTSTTTSTAVPSISTTTTKVSPTTTSTVSKTTTGDQTTTIATVSPTTTISPEQTTVATVFPFLSKDLVLKDTTIPTISLIDNKCAPNHDFLKIAAGNEPEICKPFSDSSLNVNCDLLTGECSGYICRFQANQPPAGTCPLNLVTQPLTNSGYACVQPPVFCTSGGADTGDTFCNNDLAEKAFSDLQTRLTLTRSLESTQTICSESTTLPKLSLNTEISTLSSLTKGTTSTTTVPLCQQGFHLDSCHINSVSDFGYICEADVPVNACADGSKLVGSEGIDSCCKF